MFLIFSPHVFLLLRLFRISPAFRHAFSIINMFRLMPLHIPYFCRHSSPPCLSSLSKTCLPSAPLPFSYIASGFLASLSFLSADIDSRAAAFIYRFPTILFQRSDYATLRPARHCRCCRRTIISLSRLVPLAHVTYVTTISADILITGRFLRFSWPWERHIFSYFEDRWLRTLSMILLLLILLLPSFWFRWPVRARRTPHTIRPSHFHCLMP